MPIDPININMTAFGKSLLASKPSETNLLMAAADMHGMGRLTEPQRSIPTGPEQPKVNLKRKSNRPLRVVK